VLQVGESITFRKQNLAVLHNSYRAAWPRSVKLLEEFVLLRDLRLGRQIDGDDKKTQKSQLH